MCVCTASLQSGMTSLMHAAYNGNLEACETLLKHGADVNCNLHEHYVSGKLPLSHSLTELSTHMEHKYCIVCSVSDYTVHCPDVCCHVWLCSSGRLSLRGWC